MQYAPDTDASLIRSGLTDFATLLTSVETSAGQLQQATGIFRSGLADGAGEGFAPRAVELGVRGEGDLVQVVRGLAPGEAVVTQAQFMLDSESRVQEAIAKFLKRGLAKPTPSNAAPPQAGRNHGG